MSQEEYRNEERRPAQHRSAGHGGKRAAPSHPEGERRPAPRRRRKKRLGAWGVLLYIIFVLGISAILAGVGWMWANDVLALNKAPLTATVQVEEGDTVSDVADKLKEAGLIEYKMVFKMFCALTHVSGQAGEEDAKITPGTYQLDTDMDYRALVSSMGSSSASRMVTTVTIPEGQTEAQIFQLLEEKGVSTVEQLEDTAANYDFNFSFLKGVLPLGDAKRLEGYLFPDTYEFYMGEDPVSVLNKMILRFDEIFTEQMRADIQASGHTINDAVIIASMIEKEAKKADFAKVSAVFHNRLDQGMLLQSDPTVHYVTGERRMALRQSDLAVDSPYNTYKVSGLPVGPICNPSPEAINAALYPDESYVAEKYLYFCSKDPSTGELHFSRTLEEHERAVAIYAPLWKAYDEERGM